MSENSISTVADVLSAFQSSSHPLAEILEDAGTATDPLIVEWRRQCRRCQGPLNTPERQELPQQDKDAINSLQAELPDPSLKILHLHMWFMTSHIKLDPVECRRFSMEMASLLSEGTDPFIRFMAASTDLWVKTYAPLQGDPPLDFSAYAMPIPEGHPRYIEWLVQSIQLLTSTGSRRLPEHLFQRAQDRVAAPMVANALHQSRIINAFRNWDLVKVRTAIEDFETWAGTKQESGRDRNIVKLWWEEYENLLHLMEGKTPPHKASWGFRQQLQGAELALIDRRPEKALEILKALEPGSLPAYVHTLKLIALGGTGDVLKMRQIIARSEFSIWPAVELQCLVQENRWSEALDLFLRIKADPNEGLRLESEKNILAGISPLDWMRLEILAGTTRKEKMPSTQKPLKPSASASPTALWQGRSHKATRVRNMLTRLAATDIPVTLVGPSGCGKSLAAKILHDSGSRAGQTLANVTCASIMESLMESELFGHVRGAFTGAHKARVGLLESAGKGTVVLEEVGDLPQRIQASLLRVLEERQIRPVGSTQSRPLNCRIVATTSTPLEILCKRGLFRSDLMYRLNAAVVTMAPLASRKGDIAHLARHFVASSQCTLTPDLLRALLRYSWPGNVRELRNLMQQLLLNSPVKRILDVADIPQENRKLFGVPDLPAAALSSLGPRHSPGERRRRILHLALERGAIYPKDLHPLFPVSPITLCRDLAQLTREGRLQRRKHSHAYEPA